VAGQVRRKMWISIVRPPAASPARSPALDHFDDLVLRVAGSARGLIRCIARCVERCVRSLIGGVAQCRDLVRRLSVRGNDKR